jgi:hypothetical protein
VDHSLANSAQSSSSAANCPVDHASLSKSASAPPAPCPVQHSETLDPRNHLPILTQERSPSQTTDLPTERTASSIPRDGTGTWEYPSPQQFYNALVRKGWETPENEIETIVQIHNFLNEKAWEEVQKWEAEVNRYVSVTQLRWVTSYSHARGLTGRRNCNWCALKDDQVNSHPRRGSGYLPDGSYQNVSSMSRCRATDPP